MVCHLTYQVTAALCAFATPGFGASDGATNAGSDDVVSTAEKLKDSVRDMAATLNESDTVQNVSAGILEPIYNMAEFMDFQTSIGSLLR